MKCAASVAIVAVCGVVACSNSDTNQVTPPVALGMTDKVAPIYQDQNTSIYEVQIEVPLPVREPTQAEQSALDGTTESPYPQKPFLLASDERLEIHYTVTNLDDKRQTVVLLIDPWNEFVRYHPGVQIVNDETTLPNRSGWEKPITLDGKSRLEGTITTDDTTDIAVKLATAEAIIKNPPPPMSPFDATTLLNHNFDILNRSNQGDPLTTPFIPKVIAGLTGFDLGLRAFAAMNVAVEITIDLTDLNGDRIVPSGASGKILGAPDTVLKPPTSR